jgi:hypothetical protein
MAAAHLADPQRGGLTGNLASPRWCLSPAVCYHVYCSLAGQTINAPAIVTSAGRCFRNEATTEAGRRQIEFDMREIVMLGPGDWVRTTAIACQKRLAQIAQSFNLAGTWRVAEDPFFLPRAAGQALMQHLKESKLEFCLQDGLAVASVNFHGDFFATRFELRDASGNFIHTACVAAGLDRWASSSKAAATEVCSCHH